MYCCVLEKVDIYCLLRIAFRTKQPSAGMLAARSINVILCTMHHKVPAMAVKSVCGKYGMLLYIVVAFVIAFYVHTIHVYLISYQSVLPLKCAHRALQDRKIPFTRCSCFILLHSLLLLLLLFSLLVFACNRCKFIFIMPVVFEMFCTTCCANWIILSTFFCTV